NETNDILKSFITGIKNLVDHKVKAIKCDNGTEFKNREINQFCEKNGILRQYSIARTPQQNGVAERKNKTLIEAARTMLADSKTPTLSLMRPFGCPVTILNIIDHLGKFNGKADEGFFVRYSLNSKSFRVFNRRTRIVEENLHIRFSESTPNVVGSGLDWLIDIDALTRTMNYEPIIAGTQSNGFVGTKASDNAGLLKGDRPVNAVGEKTSIKLPFDPDMPALEDDSIFNFSSDDEDDGVVADINNLDITIQVSPIPTTRIHKDHPLDQVIGWNLQSVHNKKISSKNWYTQEEGIDYDEVFAHVARIEAIRLFLAYALFKEFMVYQMDLKSAFLYGKIQEEVYVCQPPGFEDPDFPDRVYKVEKTLYGLHKAPRAWYETLSTYLSDNGFQRRKINKTLFIKRHKDNILLVQVYVDDIIFGSTKKELCIAFKKLIQDKYVAKILKKFGFSEVKTTSTPIETQKPMLKDEDGEEVDVHMYRYQVNPKVLHLHAIKRIFRYLKGQPKLGLWYPKDSPFNLVAYTDSDYAGTSLDRKSTTGGCQFLRCRLISCQCKK
ncbi:retrovirus-related pol polyprotein from transposon TNT 1-94, partial [Tanacetum coccineum]